MGLNGGFLDYFVILLQYYIGGAAPASAAGALY
jgi:hypothetical protein